MLVFVVLVCKQKTIKRVARSLSRSESAHYRTQSSRFGSTYTTRSPVPIQKISISNYQVSQ